MEERKDSDYQIRRVSAEGDEPNNWVRMASFNGAPNTRALKVYTAVKDAINAGNSDGEVEVDGVKYQFRATPTE